MIAVQLAVVSRLPLIQRSSTSRTDFRAIRIMHILLRLLLLLCLSSGLLSLPLGLGLRGSLFFSGLSCSLFFSCLLGGCLFSCFLLLSYLLRFFLLRYIAGFTNIDNRLVPIFHGLDNPVRSSEHHFVRVAPAFPSLSAVSSCMNAPFIGREFRAFLHQILLGRECQYQPIPSFFSSPRLVLPQTWMPCERREQRLPVPAQVPALEPGRPS